MVVTVMKTSYRKIEREIIHRNYKDFCDEIFTECKFSTKFGKELR